MRSEEETKRRREVSTGGSWIGVPQVTRFPRKIIFECVSVLETISRPIMVVGVACLGPSFSIVLVSFL